MITQLGKVDLAPNIAAVEAVRDLLRDASGFYHGNLGKHFVGSYFIGANNSGIGLYNLGSSGELIVLEKMIISVGTNASLTWGTTTDLDNWIDREWGQPLKIGESVSSIGRLRSKSSTAVLKVWGKAFMVTNDFFTIDMSNTIIPNGKLFLAYNTSANTWYVTFIWHEIN